MNGFNVHRKRSRQAGALLAAGFLGGLLLVAGTADAGWFDRDKAGGEEGQKTMAHRFNRHPALGFRQGILQRDVLGGWRLGDSALHLASGCIVTRGGAPQAAMAEGSQALVAGTVIGNTIIATHVMMTGQESSDPATLADQGAKQPSEADPTVGVLEGGPR